MFSSATSAQETHQTVPNFFIKCAERWNPMVTSTPKQITAHFHSGALIMCLPGSAVSVPRLVYARSTYCSGLLKRDIK